MNEVENEDLVFTLETIVDKFGEEMAPYALGLCQNLVIIFQYEFTCKYFPFAYHDRLFAGCCILEVYEHI